MDTTDTTMFFNILMKHSDMQEKMICTANMLSQYI